MGGEALLCPAGATCLWLVFPVLVLGKATHEREMPFLFVAIETNVQKNTSRMAVQKWKGSGERV